MQGRARGTRGKGEETLHAQVKMREAHDSSCFKKLQLLRGGAADESKSSTQTATAAAAAAAACCVAGRGARETCGCKEVVVV